MVVRQDDKGLFMLCTDKGHKGDSVYLQGAEEICKKCQMRKLKEKNKTLTQAGNKMHTLIIHMASTEWEETHDPETEKYTIPEFYNDILKEWEKAKGANQKEANKCDSNLERKRKDEKRI